MGELIVENNNAERMEVEEKERANGSEVVRWERYLPRMAIRVLLVEADYSTRKIVAALLRKCNYIVVAVSDGLKAWEILKQRHNSIDIMLTEFDLPSVSGYALLTLVMEHESCKNIPVIMMSSHDSISMVFKCLSKGAADFLIKPLRRNELKNLWQHVWKRLAQINDGHVPQNMTTGQHKVEPIFEKIVATNHSCDSVSSCWKDSKSSGKASDALSSCTTRFVEAESVYMENMEGVSQLKHGRASDVSEAEREQYGKNAKLDEESNALNSKIWEKSTSFRSAQITSCNEVYASNAIRVEEDGSNKGRMTRNESSGSDQQRDTANITSQRQPESPLDAIDLIGRIDDHQNCTLVHSSLKDVRNWPDCSSQLGLSLKRIHDLQNQGMNENHKLNHSNASAFSWYDNNKKLQSPFPPSYSTCMEVTGEQKCNRHLTSKEAINTSQWPSISSKGDDITAVSQPAHPEAAFLSPQLGLGRSLGGMCAGYGPVITPVFSPQSYAASSSPKPARRQDSLPLFSSPSLPVDPGAHSSSLGGCRFDEAANLSTGGNVAEHKMFESTEQHSNVNTLPPAACQSPCSTLCNGQSSALNRSECGIASEDADGNTAAATTVRKAATNDSVKDDVNNILSRDQFGRTGSCYTTQREAALAKFRLKRKERCYDKKVRYMSRKRLAEQRPRVKGQFVRQLQLDQSPAVANSSQENHT
ncbi:hypothetical protein Nepgr_019167 [Nepenthes gracilis]|uniref:Uncharacterized protein n=1 Tax=Nepenthes gracilis TaxID=150966 RepID=A0AAD3XV17_NEPGR|nr:hypothetical protein Nepgr_019167 [Nepenthes gracilis]